MIVFKLLYGLRSQIFSLVMLSLIIYYFLLAPKKSWDDVREEWRMEYYNSLSPEEQEKIDNHKPYQRPGWDRRGLGGTF